jgi:hypothetical protein
MGYNKPITARIQHSTNKGMKVQEPLLDIGSAAKQVDTSADTNLISGARDVGAASQPVDVGMEIGKGMDKAKVPQSKEKKEAPEDVEKKEAPEGPGKQTARQKAKLPKQIVDAIAAKEGNKQPTGPGKSLGPKGVGKNYKKGYYGK